MAKEYAIDFFTSQVGADGTELLSDWFRKLIDLPRAPVKTYSDVTYELREYNANDTATIFWGVFAKYRADDLPHAGSPGGDERELDLAEEEGLIEKNYFRYYRKNELLLFQRNRNASTSGQFARYLSGSSDGIVVFNPVLQPEPTRRLLRGEVLPRKLDLSISRPKNPAMYDRNVWARRVIGLLSESGGVRLRVSVTSDARSKVEQEHYLDAKIKRAMTAFVDSGDAKIARLIIEEEGLEHPIDLIADRIVSWQDVEMNGRYPEMKSMQKALQRAVREHRASLQEIFGED